MSISPASGCCFLLTFGAQGVLNDDALVEVIWLNADGREIGLGTSLVIPNTAVARIPLSPLPEEPVWTTFVSTTELSPSEAVAARIRFSVSNGSTLEIDLVSFTRSFCPPPPQFRGVSMGM